MLNFQGVGFADLHLFFQDCLTFMFVACFLCKNQTRGAIIKKKDDDVLKVLCQDYVHHWLDI